MTFGGDRISFLALRELSGKKKSATTDIRRLFPNIDNGESSRPRSAC